MSDVAKDRLLAVGNRFASFEHVNKNKNATTANKNGLGELSNMKFDLDTAATRSNQDYQANNKMSFWKKNSGKVPGRPVYGAQHPPLHAADAHLATYIKGSRASKVKTGSSFQDFEGSTLDAWDEDDSDPLKVGDAFSPNESNDNTTTGLAIRDQIGKDTPRSTPELERLSSLEENNRQPQATNDKSDSTKQSKAANLKNIMVSKLSEKLGKNRSSKNTSPVSNTDQQPDFNQENYLAPPQPPSPIRQINLDLQDQESTRLEKFGKLLAGPTTDLEQLRKLSWNGIPNALRGTTWRLLSGYLPPSIDRRQATLERKQTEYHNFVSQYYPTRHDPLHQETYRQIHIDIPRTNPLIPIFQQEVVQELFERILFIWAIRHPASGYVQGINDLVVPFFVVFLSEHIDKDVQTYNINNVSKEVLDMVEADSFWCMSKLLDGIQDNYTFAQPGIQMKVNALKNLVNRIDSGLNDHIFEYGIDYLQFTFRWMNNLLMRELPLKASIRLWDTYWSETDGFAMFHLYVCAALLTQFSKEILSQKDFQSLMMFLQNLPLKDWGDDEVSCVLAEAYRLKYMFADAPKHLGKK